MNVEGNWNEINLPAGPGPGHAWPQSIISVEIAGMDGRHPPTLRFGVASESRSARRSQKGEGGKAGHDGVFFREVFPSG